MQALTDSVGLIERAVTRLRKALTSFRLPAMCLPVRTLRVLDPHFDPLCEPRVGVPELWAATGKRGRKALA
jgi:hypothetical protein